MEKMMTFLFFFLIFSASRPIISLETRNGCLTNFKCLGTLCEIWRMVRSIFASLDLVGTYIFQSKFVRFHLIISNYYHLRFCFQSMIKIVLWIIFHASLNWFHVTHIHRGENKIANVWANFDLYRFFFLLVFKQ